MWIVWNPFVSVFVEMSLRHKLSQHTIFNGRPHWLHLELYVHTIFLFLIFYFFFSYFSYTAFVSSPLIFFFNSILGSALKFNTNQILHINFTNCVYLSLSILSTSVVWYKDHWIDLVHFMFHFYCDYCLCIFFFVFLFSRFPLRFFFFLCLFLFHLATHNHFNWSKHGKQRNETFTLDIY